MTVIYDLPEPNSVALRRSQALTLEIQQQIAANNGRISFASFMQLALYHPEFGYYNAETLELGARGDFTTAPEISPLFAYCFARQAREILNNLAADHILELGAGSGMFAKDLLTELKQLNALPKYYFIYEISPALRKKQQILLSEHCAHFATQIIWLDDLPQDFSGVIIANEVLDALPVRRFHCDETIKEACVSWDGNKFVWELLPATDEFALEVSRICNTYSLPNGYQSEINWDLIKFIHSLTNSLQRGVILFADYGYGQEEYYHPERARGTLTCFYQHRRHENPLILPGLQDITAHVDFTRVIDIAADQACSLAGYTSQATFLMACGLLNIASEIEKTLTPAQEFQLHQAIKQLTMPTEMGERIKIMAISKGFDADLMGFRLQDRRREL